MIIFSPMGHSLNGPYWKAPAKRGTWVPFSGGQGYKRIAISLVEVFERGGKSIIRSLN